MLFYHSYCNNTFKTDVEAMFPLTKEIEKR